MTSDDARPWQDELDGIQDMLATLELFDPETQQRILRFVCSRLGFMPCCGLTAPPRWTPHDRRITGDAL